MKNNENNAAAKIVGLVVLLVIVAGIAYYAGTKKNSVIKNNPQVIQNEQNQIPSPATPAVANATEKDFNSKEFSFRYNPNAEITTQLTSLTQNGSVIHIASKGETNKEKGINIYYYTAGHANYQNYQCPTNNLVKINGKDFCEFPATSPNMTGSDGVYVYTKDGKQVQIAFSAQDAKSLSDSRYINLSSIEIY